MDIMIDQPTYSFAEIIEHIRFAETPDDVILWLDLVKEEMGHYCQFHLRLIVEAARQKKLFFQKTGFY